MPEEAPSPAGEVLVAVAHGSEDPRAAATIEALMSLVRSRAGAGAHAADAGPGLDVRTAYLGHSVPSLPQVLGTIGDDQRVCVLPLLLTAAYHSKTDIPRILARSALDVTYGATLGPHPLLPRALERRLAEAEGGTAAMADRAGTAVVLAAAGSSDPDANATVARLAAQWHADGGWHTVLPAFASAAAPTPAEAVATLLRSGTPRASRWAVRRVVVATYLLAPGLFADRIRHDSLTAGAAAVSGALGAAPELADIVLERQAVASARRRRAA
ncbi:MAG: sirohydrochlorin chelatase [Streptosporangiaceae bacterium]|nr:sirohydrochlorin chelatase [Streptosporangiaceae bacterium]